MPNQIIGTSCFSPWMMVGPEVVVAHEWARAGFLSIKRSSLRFLVTPALVKSSVPWDSYWFYGLCFRYGMDEWSQRRLRCAYSTIQLFSKPVCVWASLIVKHVGAPIQHLYNCTGIQYQSLVSIALLLGIISVVSSWYFMSRLCIQINWTLRFSVTVSREPAIRGHKKWCFTVGPARWSEVGRWTGYVIL